MADPSYIYGCKGSQGEFLLDAGKPLGIQLGTQFDIYSKTTSLSDNQCHGHLIVSEAFESKSILSFIQGQPSFVVPDPFYAIQRCLPEDKKLRIYCSDEETLKQILICHQYDYSDFSTLVEEGEDADLLVSFSDCDRTGGQRCKECGVDIHRKIYFDWAKHDVISQHSSSRIGHPVTVDNPKKIDQVLRAAARFHYYLHYGEDSRQMQNNTVQMAFQHLSVKERTTHGTPTTFGYPEGPNILEGNPPSIQLEKNKHVGPFGLTISNYTDKDLFPQVFWFEGSDLTISKWPYLQSS